MCQRALRGVFTLPLPGIYFFSIHVSCLLFVFHLDGAGEQAGSLVTPHCQPWGGLMAVLILPVGSTQSRGAKIEVIIGPALAFLQLISMYWKKWNNVHFQNPNYTNYHHDPHHLPVFNEESTHFTKSSMTQWGSMVPAC